MLFFIMPLGCVLTALVNAACGFHQPFMLLIHTGVTMPLVPLGLCMKRSLTGAHYFEDTRQSNDLLVLASYCAVAYCAVVLLKGEAGEIADTGLTVAGFFLVYMPVLDMAPRLLLLLYVGYSGIACLALAFFALSSLPSASKTGAPLAFCTFGQLQVYVMEFGLHAVLRVRIWHLRQRRVDLTPQALQKVGTALVFPGERRSAVFRAEYLPGEIAATIRQRRAEQKAALVSQFLWAFHLQQAGTLSVEVLINILEFLGFLGSQGPHVLLTSPKSNVGLLDDDRATAQISSISGATRSRHPATSSMTSVSFIRHRLTDGLLRMLRN